MAAQVLVATTATPPSGWNTAGSGVPSMATVLSTPGTLSVSASSNDFTLLPSTGGRATTANTMPSSLASMPYIALPVVMSKPSISGVSPLPM